MTPSPKKQRTETDQSKTTKKSKSSVKHFAVALPASIIANAQSFELKAYLVGQIARALTVFGVNEIVIFDDDCHAPKFRDSAAASSNSDDKESSDMMEYSQSLAFFVRNLQYLETPQYLRKPLFRIHPDLKFAGLQNPLDAPHHMRANEWKPYREGVVVKFPSRAKQVAHLKEGGCWVNIGLERECWIPQQLDAFTRVTVEMSEKCSLKSKLYEGKAVSASKPIKSGKEDYWGYQVRVVKGLSKVFRREDGSKYDITIGTSERGESIEKCSLPSLLSPSPPSAASVSSVLLVLGGVHGLEAAVSDRDSGVSEEAKKDPSVLFDMYLNSCEEQTSRTIRTEEALLITLARLRLIIMSWKKGKSENIK